MKLMFNAAKAAAGPEPKRLRDTAAPVPVIVVLRPPTHLPTVEDICNDPPRAPLSYDEFAAKYGRPPADLDRIERWAAKHDLTFPHTQWKKRAQLSGVVKLEGPLKALRRAFGVRDLAQVVWATRTFFTHSQRVAVADIDDLVLHVYGLDTQRAVGHRFALHRRRGRDAAKSDDFPGYSPRDVAKRYHYPPNQGEGQCVGLIELTGVYDPKDVAHYFAEQGVSPTIRDVNLGTPVGFSSLANLEVTLDLELTASLCPAATTVVYNACSKDYSLRDFFEVFWTAVFDTKNRPSVLSVSWAFPECVAGAVLDNAEQFDVTEAAERPFNVLFVMATLLGITICASSGDTGSQAAFPLEMSATGAVMLPATFFPAASPLVLGCGGTTLAPERSREEVVWNRLGEVVIVDPGTPGAFAMLGGASGGGVSFLNARPAYQRDTPVPETYVATWTEGVYLKVAQRTGRGVPDVGANADLTTGYMIYFAGHPGTGGGTSASAPMWAALITRLNRALGRRVGFFNADLYRLQRAQKDLCTTIERGSNGAYHASEALWNACTGLGSPNGAQILRALKKSASGPR